LRKDLQPLAEPTTGIKRLFHRLKWPLDEDGTKGDIAALHRLAQVYNFSVSIEGFSLLSNRLDRAVTQIRERIRDLETDQTLQGSAIKSQLSTVINSLDGLFDIHRLLADLDDKFSKGEQSQALKALQAWIPSFDSSLRQKDLQWRRSKGSGQWLLNSQAFKKLMDGSSPQNTLFCHGAPGSGKTFLTSAVVDHLQQLSSESDRHHSGEVRVAYFYFDYVHRQEQGPDRVLGSLLNQLLSGYTTIPPAASGLKRRFEKGLDLPDWSKFVADFINICSEIPETFIVLDALDECDSSFGLARILDLVDQLQRSSSPVRLFVTSRPFSSTINKAFSSSGSILIEASDEDITLFLKERITARHDEDISDALEEEIIKAILSRSQGMFLISALQIAFILDQPSVELMRASLDDLPDDPEENFNKTIGRITAQLSPKRKLAMATLMWLTHARTALGQDEIRNALAINSDSEPVAVGPLPDPRRIIDSCLGLVVVNRDDSSFRLVHMSVQEYLRLNTARIFSSGDAQLARICLAYLRVPTLEAVFHWQSPASYTETYERFARYPLLPYVSRFWGVHASLSFTAEVEKDALEFLQSPSRVLLWSQMSWITSPEWDRKRDFSYSMFPRDVTPLHIAAQFDLSKLLQDQLSCGGVEINCRDSNGETPLMVASLFGASSVAASLLLREDLEINAVNTAGRPAFCAAILAHQGGIVQSLLHDSRLDVNLGRPLFTAVNGRDAKMVEMLLSVSELDINAEDDTGQTALWLAVSEIYRDIVDLLLKRKDLDPTRGDPNRKDQQPLVHWALTFVEDIDIMTDQELCDCALMVLTLDKHPAISSEISEEGIVGVARTFYRNATSVGKKRFKDNISQFVGVNGRTLLHEAAEAGDAEEVKEFLEYGADPQARTEDGRTPLYAAAGAEDSAAVEILLNAGANPNATDDGGWSVLHVAARCGREKNVRLLLSHGADVNLRDQRGYSVLIAACYGCSEPEVTRLLLENKADPNVSDRLGSTPLHWAAYNGNKFVCELLLDHGAEVDKIAPTIGTPLSLATWGMNDCIEPLLAAGSDPNILDLYGRTSLDWAAGYAPVFRKFGFAAELYSATPKATTTRVLKKSARMKVEEHLREGTPGDISLCRILNFLGDTASAKMVSRGLVKSVKDNGSFDLAIQCAICKSVSGPHFVCAVCPMINLCETCMGSHTLPVDKIPWCRGHAYWRVPDEEWSHVRVLEKNEIREVLEMVAKKHSCAEDLT
ncbi:ankyrin repeat-containing domain protein, partial [Cercophora scortea]